MALVKEMYSANGVNRIYQLLKNEAEKGIPKEYDIKVDEMKVVSRNCDPDRFFEHEEFILANSKNITVNIYDGTSPRCTKYTLMLKEEGPATQELSGFEKSVNTRILQERKNWEYDRLKKENSGLKQELADAGKYTEKLEQKITELRAEKQKTPGKLTDAIISLAGAYVSRNPEALSGIPLLGSLLGGGQPNHAPEGSNGAIPDDMECTVTEGEECTYAKKEELKYTGIATDEDFDRLESALIPLFQEQHRETVASVVSVMYHDNQLIRQVAELLPEQPDQKKAA
jgi:FtsZ-binding cell division protein ZapB